MEVGLELKHIFFIKSITSNLFHFHGFNLHVLAPLLIAITFVCASTIKSKAIFPQKLSFLIIRRIVNSILSIGRPVISMQLNEPMVVSSASKVFTGLI